MKVRARFLTTEPHHDERFMVNRSLMPPQRSASTNNISLLFTSDDKKQIFLELVAKPLFFWFEKFDKF